MSLTKSADSLASEIVDALMADAHERELFSEAVGEAWLRTELFNAWQRIVAVKIDEAIP